MPLRWERGKQRAGSPEGQPGLSGSGVLPETQRAAGGHGHAEEAGVVRVAGVVWGPLLRSLPSVMHLPSGWQQAWSGVRWSEHGLSGAVTWGR